MSMLSRWCQNVVYMASRWCKDVRTFTVDDANVCAEARCCKSVHDVYTVQMCALRLDVQGWGCHINDQRCA
jgi:hypothetical protein